MEYNKVIYTSPAEIQPIAQLIVDTFGFNHLQEIHITMNRGCGFDKAIKIELKGLKEIARLYDSGE